MPLPSWIIRCLPGLSVISLLILAEFALGIIQTLWFGTSPTKFIAGQYLVVAQVIFVSWGLFLHLLATFFPLRLSWRVWKASGEILRANTTHRPTKTVFQKEEEDEDSTEQNGFMKYHQLRARAPLEPDVVHSIIIPSYKEDIQVLEDTLKVLASHQSARSHYDVCLAMEERDPNAKTVATKLIAMFGERFLDMQFTLHPASIDGEAPGKSSNVGWAAQRFLEKYTDRPNWEHILLTVMDSDTHLLSTYFDIITRRHIENALEDDSLDMTLYMPPIIFDRNAHQVPRFVRVADLMWCGAGLSCFQITPRIDTIAIPTSVYTLTLPVVDLVKGWDTGPEAIGEDMHMMLKSYFLMNGKLNIECVASPASHCNVASGMKGVWGWFDGIRARYQQALRHMWGCLDTGFAIQQWSQLGTSERVNNLCYDSHANISLGAKFSFFRVQIEEGNKLTLRNIDLLTRIFEAHFLPAHLFMILITSSIYLAINPSTAISRWVQLSMDVMAYLRTFGFLTMLFYFFFCYERYHKVCVDIRTAALKKSGLYRDIEDQISRRDPWSPLTWLDYVIFPVAGLIFGGLPLLHAAFSHFWSVDLNYKVSAKPKRIIVEQVVRMEEGRL
ncbi:hypothetical protein EYR41_001197 [Orbilia oligospora]|uniref:Glycosyltransferase 2-like domain-containing protein n=1 Tax=Orbilia oligospora TaxID=2813651 RepID=A0A7C8P606_ORBOL|nr:hypothetical protein TWF751_002845 [Orbilia oligospora]KAF3274653.1 hypothetical protein TWF132_003297 [Orbilia oligospora]TGJ74160.1 hypothetical protein EYR41_001197 [Orbilia oligospora]